MPAPKRGNPPSEAVIVHGCTIKDRVLVGMGAIIMDGAVIGENSVVGTGALVVEGTVVPSKSVMLGSPTRVGDRQRTRSEPGSRNPQRTT